MGSREGAKARRREDAKGHARGRDLNWQQKGRTAEHSRGRFAQSQLRSSGFPARALSCAEKWAHAKTRRREGKRRGGCSVFGQAEAREAVSDRLMRLQSASRFSGKCPIGCAKLLGHFLLRPRTIGGLPRQQAWLMVPARLELCGRVACRFAAIPATLNPAAPP